MRTQHRRRDPIRSLSLLFWTAVFIFAHSGVGKSALPQAADPGAVSGASVRAIGGPMLSSSRDDATSGRSASFRISSTAGFSGAQSVFVVSNTSDSGPGSLREALDLAGTNAGPDTVIFAIPTTDPGYDSATGVWTIQITTTYYVPGGTVVDGTITDGDGKPRPGIELDGSTLASEGYTGLTLGDDVVLRGLIVNHCQYGIWVSRANVVIENCYVGTDPTGSEARPNRIDGILLANGATGVVIQNNLISGNKGTGIRMFGKASTGNQIRNNRIGTDLTGTVVLSNKRDGIRLHAATHDNIIEENLISGNGRHGIFLADSGTVGNVILANVIGTDTTRENAMGNGAYGILIYNGSQYNVIGPGNVIAYNNLDGVQIKGTDPSLPTTGNTVTENRITANGGLGIRTMQGGNLEVAPPTILSVNPGEVIGKAGPGHIIEVFADEDNEGALFLGTTTADADGNFVLALSGLPSLPNITATATDADGNTSQFSQPYITGVEEGTSPGMPAQFRMDQNYPNPFNPSTIIPFALPERSRVKLTIYDVLGRTITTLVDRQLPPGEYRVQWTPEKISSGLYFARLEAHTAATRYRQMIKLFYIR